MIKNNVVLTEDWATIMDFVAELEGILEVKRAYDTIRRTEESTRFSNGGYILDHKYSKLEHEDNLAAHFNKVVIDYVNGNIDNNEDDEIF